EIERIVYGIKERGITTIIVEQNAVAALRLADRAVILDTGELVFAGAAKELLESEELRNEYLAICRRDVCRRNRFIVFRLLGASGRGSTRRHIGRGMRAASRTPTASGANMASDWIGSSHTAG